MATEVRWRRGTKVEHNAFIGAMSEITHETTANNLRVHDGVKPGGYRTLMESERGVAGGVATLDENGMIPKSQLGDLSNVNTYGSVADVQAASIGEGVLFLRTAGYYAAGTGGGAIYKRVATQPNHAGKIQSSDGAWWELAESNPLITMFGAIADGTTDVSDRWQEALNFIKLQGDGLGGGLGVPNNGRDYIVKKTLTFPLDCVIELYGIGMPRVRFQPPAPDVASDFIKMGSGVYSQSINILRGVVIWGNGATGRNCITGQYLSNLKLYDVFMFNFVGWCVDVADCYCFSMVGGQAVGNSDGVAAGGIRLTRASGNQGLMSHVRVNGFKGANKTGLTIAGSGTDSHYGMRIDNCSFEYNTLGIFVNAARGLTVDTCYFEFNTESNITVNGGANNLVQSISFVGNSVFEGGCNFINARGLTVSGNSFQFNSSCYIEDATGSYSIGVNTFINGSFVFGSGTPRKQYENESVWLTFASTWISSGTQPSVGNGSLVFKYKRSGNTVTCVVTLTTGSTSTYGAVGYGFRLPFNVAAGVSHIGKAGCYDASADAVFMQMTAVCAPGDNYVSLRADAGGVVGPAAPITFASGDKIYASFTYECVS
ncbi:hypothetical protein OHI65_13510 [Brucella sp. MAB-22]|uniref:hyaluronate lyase N-terminal domain-containing protein n=1 Tax=Brucella sp. MAB-22 TaxID=2986424 RepID=UPI00221F775E|nr:hypothetical protein [Brucella sp. MAB-22]UYT57504.1 hypothetical protein OHI65_13510 [Brucella sp. MAB-22]